jgi:hypothetical protein
LLLLLADFSPRFGIAYSPPWKKGFLKKLTGGPGNSSLRAGDGHFFTAIEGQVLAFETGNAPYGLTYTSPEQPLFANPLIGTLTGTQYPQEFPVTVPPNNVSAKSPDSNVNWSSYFPINGIDAYFPGKLPFKRKEIVLRIGCGLPVTLINPNDTALIGSFANGVNGNGFADLNVSSGSLQLNHNPGNGQHYFNTSLFSVPPLGSPGNAPRRFFYGPGMNNWDIALVKKTTFSESKALEFRLETFNTFNRPQFFGANSVDGNINDSTFGQVVEAMPPRLVQVALKYRF